MGIAFVVSYAVIASKLLTCVWNLLLLTTSVRISPIIMVMLAKSLCAASVGLFMFFLFPYWLHRSRTTTGA